MNATRCTIEIEEGAFSSGYGPGFQQGIGGGGGGPPDIAALLAWLLSLPKPKKKKRKGRPFPHLNPRGIGDLPTLMATINSLDTLDSSSFLTLPGRQRLVFKNDTVSMC